MDLNKTESKFLKELLKEKMSKSEFIKRRSLENLQNPGLPNYNAAEYKKNTIKLDKVIKRCQDILGKLPSI